VARAVLAVPADHGAKRRLLLRGGGGDGRLVLCGGGGVDGRLSLCGDGVRIRHEGHDGDVATLASMAWMRALAAASFDRPAVHVPDDRRRVTACLASPL